MLYKEFLYVCCAIQVGLEYYLNIYIVERCILLKEIPKLMTKITLITP